jgi:hypothetical protein
MKIKYLIIFTLLSLTTVVFSQNESIFIQNEVAVKKIKSCFVGGGIGIGMPYGNFGGRIVAKLTSGENGKGFGLSAGVGSRFVPLSLVTPLENSKGDKETMDSPYTMWAKMGIPYNWKTVHGLSYSVGIMIFLYKNITIGLNFVQHGTYLSVTENINKPVYGYNTSVEGFIPLGKAPLAINIGGELGLNFVNYQTINLKKELSLGINAGLHLGLVYLFKY